MVSQKMKKNIVIIALIFLALTAQATTTSLAVVKISLDEKGDASVRYNLIVDSRNGDIISIKVFDSKNLKVYDAQNQLEFTENSGTVAITPRSFAEKYSITIEYESSRFTTKQDGEWFFELSFLQENESTAFEITLPENSKLLSYEPNAIVFLENEKLKLEWNLEKQEQEITLKAKYSFTGNSGQPISIAFMAFGLVAIVAIGGAFYFLRRKNTKNPQPKPQIVPQATLKENADNPNDSASLNGKRDDMLKFLGENEAKVIKELLKEDNITQRSIMVKTGLPKSTLSRTIKKLEVKGLLKVNSIGNTNKLSLSEEFKK